MFNTYTRTNLTHTIRIKLWYCVIKETFKAILYKVTYSEAENYLGIINRNTENNFEHKRRLMFFMAKRLTVKLFNFER